MGRVEVLDAAALRAFLLVPLSLDAFGEGEVIAEGWLDGKETISTSTICSNS